MKREITQSKYGATRISVNSGNYFAFMIEY